MECLLMSNVSPYFRVQIFLLFWTTCRCDNSWWVCDSANVVINCSIKGDMNVDWSGNFRKGLTREIRKNKTLEKIPDSRTRQTNLTCYLSPWEKIYLLKRFQIWCTGTCSALNISHTCTPHCITWLSIGSAYQPIIIYR